MIIAAKSRFGMRFSIAWLNVVFLALMTANPQAALAQQVTANPLHAFALNRDKEMQIDGYLSAVGPDGIETYESDLGMVTARLGEVVIRARALKIQKTEFRHPLDLRIAGENGAHSFAEKVEAVSGVVIDSGGLTAIGERLVFEMRQDSAMLAGDVVVWLGRHVMRGGRLTTSMKNGASRIEGIRAALGDRVPVRPDLSDTLPN